MHKHISALDGSTDRIKKREGGKWQAFTFLIFMLLGIPETTNGKIEQPTYVIITIDYCYTRPDIIYTKLDGAECGIKKIMDICDNNGVTPTWFFSPYDYKEVGEEKVKAIIQYIKNRGGDIQLHTHPGPFYDERRPDLYHYSLEEQIEIIRHGKEKIYEWTGKRVIAHRAGDYGADLNTMKALATNKIFFDSSSFYRQPSCKLDALNLPINNIAKKSDVVQVPVSVFKLMEYASIFGYSLPHFTRIRKVDIDWADYNQLKSSITQLATQGIRTATLFMHFHSFLSPANDISLKKTKADFSDIEEFQKILTWMRSEPKLEVISFEEFIKKYNQAEIKPSNNDYLPVYEKEISLVDYSRKLIGVNRENVLTYMTVVLVVLVVGTFAVTYLFRQYTSKRT
jgi:peptidoglycan/xylan/chitin deacetylase (PgdA/CDA1 family)